MTANKGPAPLPTGTGPSENSAATKPLSLGQHASAPGVTAGGLATRQHSDQRFGQRLRRARRRAVAAEQAARRADGDTKLAPCARSLLVEVGRHTAWLRGENIRALLEVAQIEQDKRQYDPVRGCWMVLVGLADQVTTVAEWRQRRYVTVAAVDR